MLPRDGSIPLPGYEGTNVWYAPGTAINSTEAFHHASDLEEAAYLANRYMFIAIMVIMVAYILAQMPYTYLRMRARGFWQGFRLRNGITSLQSIPHRLRHPSWPIPIRRIPLINLPLSEFAIVAVIWAAGVGVAGWCQATFLTDASRSTLVVMSLLALTAGLGIKAGGIGTWVVHGYTAVNFIHRWTGRLVLLLSTLHVIAYLVVFYQAGIAKQEMAKPENYLAAVGYGGLLLTGILSVGYVRRRWWLLFKFGHHIGILLLMAGLNYHSQDVVPYLIAIWALLVINTIVRSITTRITTATITTLPGAGSTLVSLPLNQGFTPGQHVRIRLLVPSLWGSLLESHPFTIASAEGDNVNLVIKASGDWTRSLYDLSLERNQIRCSIEGPYGGPLNFLFPAFRAAVIIVGGSGISFGLGVVRGLLSDMQSDRSRCQHVVLIWTVKDRATLSDLSPMLLEMLRKAEKIKITHPAFQLDLHLHFTSRESTSTTSEEKIGVKMVTPSTELEGSIHEGRPDLASDLAGVIASLPDGDGGVGVGACGPVALGDGVERIVKAVPAQDRKRVGGVELHLERFSL